MDEFDIGAVVAETLEYLTVEPTRDDPTRWVGDTPDWFGPVLFGGFVIAQAIVAATRNAPDGRRLHSMHAYFLRPVVAGSAITYDVQPIREGRSFTSRRVEAAQNGKPTLEMTCSFTADTDGYVYDLPSRSPAPLPSETATEQGPGPWVAGFVGPTPADANGTRESTHRMWFRVPAELPDDIHLHTAMLGFATDWTGVGGRPLHLDGDIEGMISLDHAAWFHRPARADEWLFYDVQSLVNAGGRGLLRGVMRDRDGQVVVSVAQEMRLTPVELLSTRHPERTGRVARGVADFRSMVEISETRYAKSGDVSIAYQVIGDGPRDLIYVPGIVSHLEFFHELPGYTEFLEGLASFARVIAFDKRGNGLSDRVAGAASLEDRMDDIRAVMDAAGSERATLLGVSEGGPISLLFAATYPSRVEAVVGYETFVCYGGVPGELESHSEGPDAHQAFTELMVEMYGTGESFLGFGTSRIEEPRVVELWGRAERLSNSPGGMQAMYAALLETDVRAALPSVQAPCLIIHGTEMSMFEQQSRYLADHVPNGKLVQLEGVDHYPWFAGVDRIVAEIEEFLTGARSSTVDERVLATLLFTDIVGSTEQFAAMGDRRWHEVIERYYTLVRRCVERFRGIEVGTEGDGFLSRFDGPARAVARARAIREGVQGLGIEIRAGVHTGEIELRGDEISGLAVHIGARIGALAGTSEVLVSRTVEDLVVGSGNEFADRGTHELKGVPDTWQLYALAD